MRFLASLSVGILLSPLSVVARNPRHAGPKAAERLRLSRRHPPTSPNTGNEKVVKRDGPRLVQETEKTAKYAVDGTKIPDVSFDVGESYAGLMPISPNSTDRQLYFWFFPTDNPDGKDDLTVWLNGGPGCSSLEGFLQENGPFLWQYGTFKPVKNPWSWTRLTNMLWVEQPVGTGFSLGESTETNQEEAAASFLGFFKNFVDTFGMKHKKIYLTGESYAGMYVPHIADAMFNKRDTVYFDVRGTMIYDPSINTDKVMAEMPAVPYVEENMNLFRLNDTFMQQIKKQADSCGYTDFWDKHFKFPPDGPMPIPPATNESCNLWTQVKEAVTFVNPCFDVYQIATTCPLLWDVLGYPGSFPYVPEGANIYFNRKDVKTAINAPQINWQECSNIALDQDTSLPSGLTVLPSVIERSNRTIIAHGNLDFILLVKGSLMTIQNMTWNGKQGFSKEPSSPFYVPYHEEESLSTLAGSGIAGTTHTERGLTWVEMDLTGHMVPQYHPSGAYRQMEYLLGRIGSLSEVSPFTTQPNVPQSNWTIPVNDEPGWEEPGGDEPDGDEPDDDEPDDEEPEGDQPGWYHGPPHRRPWRRPSRRPSRRLYPRPSWPSRPGHRDDWGR